jgi:hypothetical protein
MLGIYTGLARTVKDFNIKQPSILVLLRTNNLVDILNQPIFVTKNVFSTDVHVLKDKHFKIKMTQSKADIVDFKPAQTNIPFKVVGTLK